MFIGVVLFFVSLLGVGFVFLVWDFVVWWLVGGFGIGIVLVIVLVYIVEIVLVSMCGWFGLL